MGGSGVIPRWKLRRELTRVWQQILNMPMRIMEPGRKRRYDRDRWQKIRISEGALPRADKLCLFLVWQPGQLNSSVTSTLRFLQRNGYSVLVVANGGLIDAAREACLPLCWRLLERPNFGYDFGGYRDGVHWLEHESIVPERFLILNDSIWFPLNQDSDVLSRLEGCGFDPAGLLLHTRSRYEHLNEKRPRGSFIESYVLLMGKVLYESEAFRAFWRDYPLTNSKQLTIKRGEIGFSKAMWDAGFNPGALSRRSFFLEAIRQKDDDFLSRTLRYAAYSDDDLRVECDQLLAAGLGPDWRARVLDHIERTVYRRRFNTSFCSASEEIFGLSFHKKNRETLFRRGRISFLRAVDDGLIRVSEAETLAEIRALSHKQEATSKGDGK